MDKKTRQLVIVCSIITFIVVPVAATMIISRMNPKPESAIPKPTNNLPRRSDAELLTAITDSNPGLTSEGKPTIAIMRVAVPENGWYIVTIRQTFDAKGENPAKVLLRDSGQNAGLSVLLGPGTDFPDSVTAPLHLPVKVLTELKKT